MTTYEIAAQKFIEQRVLKGKFDDKKSLQAFCTRQGLKNVELFKDAINEVWQAQGGSFWGYHRESKCYRLLPDDDSAVAQQMLDAQYDYCHESIKNLGRAFEGSYRSGHTTQESVRKAQEHIRKAHDNVDHAYDQLEWV